MVMVSIGKEGNAHTISERPVNMRMTVRIMTRAKTDPMTASGDDRNDKHGTNDNGKVKWHG